MGFKSQRRPVRRCRARQLCIEVTETADADLVNRTSTRNIVRGAGVDETGTHKTVLFQSSIVTTEMYILIMIISPYLAIIYHIGPTSLRESSRKFAIYRNIFFDRRRPFVESNIFATVLSEYFIPFYFMRSFCQNCDRMMVISAVQNRFLALDIFIIEMKKIVIITTESDKINLEEKFKM